jgi:gephyrin
MHIMDTKLKAAILIVSDTASEDPKTDKVFDALAPILAAEGKWEHPAFKIVPDNVFQIQQSVCDWSDSPDWYNLILLSGGTGFAIKDNTPEVCDLYRLSIACTHDIN